MKYYTNPLVVRSLHVFDYGHYYGYRFARKQSGKVFMWWMRGVCERQWSTLWLLWVRPSASRESDRSKFQHYKHYTRWANYPTKKQPLEWCLTWMDPRSKRRLYSLFQFPFGRILPVFLSDMSIERKLPSGIYQGKKAPKFPILLP